MSIGYEVFDHNGTGYLELQRDDEEAIFDDDDAAWTEFIGVLEMLQGQQSSEYGMPLEMAISLLNNWREPMARVMRGLPPKGTEE
jgi:hypothetical protein